MRLGAHVSIAGGLDKAFDRATQLDFGTMQIFTKSSQQWAARPMHEGEISRFHSHLEEGTVCPVVGHAAYLINLASPDPSLWRRSLEALLVEILRCAALGVRHLVIHPGAHVGSGERAGIERVSAALNEALADTPGKVQIVLENTAGQGSSLGARFEHLAQLIECSAYPERLGICFDTCHAFAAGYELRTDEGYARTIEELDASVGLDRLRVLHLNDSKTEMGSRVDRHEHIGQGALGLEAFRKIMTDGRLRHLPMILETPKGPDMEEDRVNLATLRSLTAGLPATPNSLCDWRS